MKTLLYRDLVFEHREIDCQLEVIKIIIEPTISEKGGEVIGDLNFSNFVQMHLLLDADYQVTKLYSYEVSIKSLKQQTIFLVFFIFD